MLSEPLLQSWQLQLWVKADPQTSLGIPSLADITTFLLVLLLVLLLLFRAVCRLIILLLYLPVQASSVSVGEEGNLRGDLVTIFFHRINRRQPDRLNSPPLRIKKESVTRAGWYHARDEAIKPLIPEQLCTTPWAALPPIGITRLSQFRHSPHITGSSYPALEFKRKRS